METCLWQGHATLFLKEVIARLGLLLIFDISGIRLFGLLRASSYGVLVEIFLVPVCFFPEVRFVLQELPLVLML